MTTMLQTNVTDLRRSLADTMRKYRAVLRDPSITKPEIKWYALHRIEECQETARLLRIYKIK